MSKGGRYAAKGQKHLGGLMTVLTIAVLALTLVAAVLTNMVLSRLREKQEDSALLSRSEPTTEITLPTQPTTEATTEATIGDLESPVIDGVVDQTVLVGDTVSYRSGVTVTDDQDPAPELDVDSSAVDLTQPGEYTVIYIATDASGNEARAEAVITVREPTQEETDYAAAFEKAAEILSTILEEDMTTEDQVWAIYEWTRTHIGYAGHSDRGDWVLSAYKTLKTRTGDCYGYFAVSKLLLEQLGIPNIDVQKVRNYPDDSDHFWSLVSIDGGETYYHFDATPRKGQVTDLCMLTDAKLDAFSKKNRNSHNRDMSLYPATPEE